MIVKLKVVKGMSTMEVTRRYGDNDPESVTSSMRCGHSTTSTVSGCGHRIWLDAYHDKNKVLVECQNCGRLLISRSTRLEDLEEVK